MFVNLLNTLLESVNEYHLFVFEKAFQFNFFDEQILSDPEMQTDFVNVIRDRLNNKDKFYIIEKYKNSKIAKAIEKGMKRRESNDINENSTIDYFIERIKSLVILRNAQEIVGAVKTADTNMNAGLIEEKDLSNIKSRLYNLLNELTFDADFGEMELNDFTKRERDKLSENKDKIVPTWSEKMNHILNGGAYPSKFYFIAAPPGFGKSLFLVNIGKEALMHDKTVYHFSLEMTTSEVMQRYDCLISGRPMMDIINSPPEVIQGYVDKFMKEHKGYLLIKEFPPEVLTKDMLAMYIKRKIMASNRKPDLIIVDYADLMKSTVKNTERRNDLGLIYRQLKALAAEFGCPVWTASQINRAGFQRTESDISNLSESWEKAMIADLVLVVRQSREEFEQNRLRLYVGKNRSGQARVEIHCEIDYKNMIIRESDQVPLDDFTEIGFGSFSTKKKDETGDEMFENE